MPNVPAVFGVHAVDGRGLPATGLTLRAVGINTALAVLLEEESTDGIPSAHYVDAANACGAEDQDVYELVGATWTYRSTEKWSGSDSTPITRSKFFVATTGQNTYDLGETARGVPQQHMRNGLSMSAARNLWTLSAGHNVVLVEAYSAQILAGDEMEFIYEI
ncbi:MAG: hypothetical protein A2Y38_02580 [Spirochaetes bacterium GWB1_59_5]|nr:MAG: hypothetical protein A2Y38_02580 [Spirochaetes bacterium GWB1_59_5]